MLYSLQPFKLLAVDPSLRRPAFTVLMVDPSRQHLRIETLVDIDNRLYDKSHGFLLKRIYDMTYRLALEADVFVRECGYITPTAGCASLLEVAGVVSLALWDARASRFDDIPATQVKKLVAGNGKATKEMVAERLARFVGPREYDCLDQSDAIAVGISWLKLMGILIEQPGHYTMSTVLDCDKSRFSESMMSLLKNTRKVG